MKKTQILLSLLASLLAFVSCGQSVKSTITMSWQLNENNLDSGYYENTFYIVNNGKEKLDNNWIIYLNEMPRKVTQDPNSEVVVELISSTFHKMYPSSSYKGIEPGDTLAIVLRTAGNNIRTSFNPSNPYMVRINADGTETAPQDVPFTILPFTYLPDASKLSDGYYPYGDVLYDENEALTKRVALNAMDIFPSLKSVDLKSGELPFTLDVNIEFDPLFKNEAEILQEKLQNNFGSTISKTGKTKIILAKANANFKAVNDEHYQITVDANGVKIEGHTAHAIFNGVQSLLGMAENGKLPYAIVSDYPDFSYRGQMLDVSRNFTTKENVLKLIDILPMYKINKFHMHLGDDEGWRIEIPGLDELTQVGARRGHTLDEMNCLYPAYGGGWNPDSKTSLGSGYYTRQDFIEILQYAKKRHITVISEIDLPAHSRAAVKSMLARYEKYISTDRAKAEEYLLSDFADTSRYVSAQAYTDNVINVALPSTYRFVEKVIEEINKIYEDAGIKMEQIHLGGDEIPKGAWAGSPLCHKYMADNQIATISDLKDHFFVRILQKLKEKNIQLLGWEDIVMHHDGSVSNNFKGENILSYCWNTVPTWNSDQTPYRLANAGTPVILSNVTNYYFDLAYNRNFDEPGLNWGGYVNEYASFDLLPYDIYRSVRRKLSGKPVEVVKNDKSKMALQPEARKFIHGVQGQLWSETIRSFDMIEYSLFPKMFGMVERAWNAEPEWSKSATDDLYKEALLLYNSKIADKELPRLSKLLINFRVAQPGIKIIGGKLYANCPLPDAVIYYTTDGSEPNEQSAKWTTPVDCSAKLIKAKAFYLGKSSTISMLVSK